MKIGILAPLKRELSKDTKGGRPRIVYNLAEGLVKRNHDVTVFGTGDSVISGKLISIIPKALFHLPQVENEFYRHLIYLSVMLEELRRHKGEFDVIHNHLYPEVLPLLVSGELPAPMVTTVHTQMTRELGDFFARYPKAYFAPISDRQKALYPELNYTKTVYNGIDETAFTFCGNPGSYLLFVGRIREFFTNEKGDKIDPKGVTDAIRVAQKAHVPLKIVGNVESYPFFEREIAPHLSDTIQFIGNPKSAEGNLTLDERVELYQGAKALLLPIHWEEPFGIVMIEALATGTPVVAYRMGAIPEVIAQGKTGFVVENEDEMVIAVGKLDSLNRADCRKSVEDRFTIKNMVEGYEDVYQTIAGRS
ncbi:glycosyltransferase family 4 protein [Candidatus Gottesmanbacteria bacterium]|nr:glycosyltransferase family 4 protein [Candidatus Gottesmanbacteria bacterium]